MKVQISLSLFVSVFDTKSPTVSLCFSVCPHPLRGSVPAPGGAAQPVPLLPAGAGLRPGPLLCPGVYGAEGPAA